MIAKKTVFVLGNPIEKLDSSAVKIIPLLKKKFPRIDFIRFDPTEELPLAEEKNLILIDTILGLKKTTKFNDLNRWKLAPRVTAHDFDLSLHLGILKKLGKIKKITIIGIPVRGKKEETIRYVENILASI